jgi:hypothetical protein
LFFNSAKSTIRLASADSDSDDNNNNNNQHKIRILDHYKTDLSSSQTNKTVDSLVFDDDNDTNSLERKCKKIIPSFHCFDLRNLIKLIKKIITIYMYIASHNMTFNNIRNEYDKINYEDIQMLIQNLQQSGKIILEFSSNRKNKRSFTTRFCLCSLIKWRLN